MLDILNNPWAVGIGGGILSGLAVTFITRVFLEKKDDRELIERVSAANKELIYAIRPCIAEGSIPSLGVIDSLVAATGRKYRLVADKLSTSRQLIDDLIKEVMDSSFISASTKAEYCTKLNGIFEVPATTLISQSPRNGPKFSEVIVTLDKAPREIDRELRYKEYRQKLLSMASVMMGVMAAVMTSSFAFVDLFKMKASALEPLKVLLPMMATVMAVMVAVLATRVTARISTHREDRKRDADDDDLKREKKG